MVKAHILNFVLNKLELPRGFPGFPGASRFQEFCNLPKLPFQKTLLLWSKLIFQTF